MQSCLNWSSRFDFDMGLQGSGHGAEGHKHQSLKAHLKRSLETPMMIPDTAVTVNLASHICKSSTVLRLVKFSQSVLEAPVGWQG